MNIYWLSLVINNAMYWSLLAVSGRRPGPSLVYLVVCFEPKADVQNGTINDHLGSITQLLQILRRDNR
jgi:hypothetical protein